MTTQPFRPQRVRALAVCDETLDFLRRHGSSLWPPYLFLSLPYIAAGIFFIDVVVGLDADGLPAACAALVATTFVRWLGGAVVQRRAIMLRDGREAPPLAEMLRPYLWMRLLWEKRMAGPLALDPLTRGAPWASWRRLQTASGSFSQRYGFAMFLFFLLGLVQVFATKYFLMDLVLPSVLGLDSQALRSVLSSRFWWLGTLLAYLLVMEFYQLIAGVVMFETLASRWSGSDLLVRIHKMRATRDATR